MRIIKILIFFFINFYFTNLFAQTIVVVDIQHLIDSNQEYIQIIKKIEKSQEINSENLIQKEEKIKKILNDINESKLILSESEINLQIENYNNEINNFQKLVDEFNFHYQNEIIKIRENILKEIIILLEKYAIEKETDLILDSTSYLIASNSLDITEMIKDDLKEINLKLEYKDFEKY